MPVIQPGQQTDFSSSLQVTYRPKPRGRLWKTEQVPFFYSGFFVNDFAGNAVVAERTGRGPDRYYIAILNITLAARKTRQAIPPDRPSLVESDTHRAKGGGVYGPTSISLHDCPGAGLASVVRKAHL